jgi:thermitase
LYMVRGFFIFLIIMLLIPVASAGIIDDFFKEFWDRITGKPRLSPVNCDGADLTGNGIVDAEDLSLIRENFGCGPPDICIGDTDGNGIVDAVDLSAIKENLGRTDCLVECIDDIECDDGLYCNGQEICNFGVCETGSSVSCANDGISCTLATCIEDIDDCEQVPDDSLCLPGEICDLNLGCVIPECIVNEDCDDTMFCNGQEICNAGFCEFGAAIVCNDGVACTLDACNEVTDICSFVPNNGLCNIGESCDLVLGCICNGGVCEPGVVDATISIATLKNGYGVGEVIELTDPPGNDDLDNFLLGEVVIKFKKDVTFTNKNVIGRTTANLKNLFGIPASKVSTNRISLNKKFDKFRATKIKKVFPLIERKIKNGIQISEIENELDRVVIVDLDSEQSLLDVVNELSGIAGIEYVEPNFIDHGDLIPNDARYSEQWPHQITQAESGWDIEQGDGIVIAVVDSGIDYLHEDISVNMLGDCTTGCPDGKGYDFVDINTDTYISSGYLLIDDEDYSTLDNEPMDYYGHGTHASGIAAAVSDNGIGIAGVCHHCTIMPVRAGFAINHQNKCFNTCLLFQHDDIANALYYAADQGADIISMSFGGSDSNLKKDSIDYAYSKGAVLIASAGNNNKDFVSQYPSGYENVIAVSSTTPDDEKSFDSDYGLWVDVAAPGGNIGTEILSTVPLIGTKSDPSGYGLLRGTSMAAPYVSGLAGLILSKTPSLNNEQIRNIIRQGVDSPLDQSKYIGTGRVNVQKALQINSIPSLSFDTLDYEEIVTGTIDIIGSASSDNFQEYKLSFAPGKIFYDNNELFSTFHTSSIPIENDKLFSGFDTSQLSFGFNTFQIEVVDTFGFVFEERVFVLYLDPTIETLFESGESIDMGSITVENIISDARKEIIFATSFGNHKKLYVLHSDGSLLNGFPITLDFLDFPANTEPSIIDLNNDGKKDIIIVIDNTVYAVQSNGLPLNGFPLDISNDMLILNGASTSDLNGDGYSEIVTMKKITHAPCEFSTFEYCSGTLYVIEHDGSIRDGFPKVLGVIAKLPAIGDVDDNDKLEIVYSGDRCADPFSECTSPSDGLSGEIGIINYEGNFLSNWPKQITEGISNSPVLVDLDLDGDLEIIVSTESATTYIYNHDGNLFAGWELGKSCGEGTSESIVSDVIGDGYPEIIVSSRGRGPIDEICVFDIQGNLISSISGLTGEIRRKIVTGNFDDENKHELAFIDLIDEIKVTEINGADVNGWPRFVQDAQTPTVTDIDNDGYTDLITFTKDGKIIKIPTFSLYKKEGAWETFHYNNKNSNCFECDIIELPQSRLDNYGVDTINGNLVFIIATVDGLSSNDVYDQQINVAPGETVKLDLIFNALGVSVSDVGEYKVIARLEDSSGNVMKDLAGNDLEASWEFSIV